VQARLELVKVETLATTVLRGAAGDQRPGVVGGTVGAGVPVRVAVVAAG